MSDEQCDCGWVPLFGKHRKNRCVCGIVVAAATNPTTALIDITSRLIGAIRNASSDDGNEDAEITETTLEEVFDKANKKKCDCQWTRIAGKHRRNRCTYRVLHVAMKNPGDAARFFSARSSSFAVPAKNVEHYNIDELISALESTWETPNDDSDCAYTEEDADDSDEENSFYDAANDDPTLPVAEAEVPVNAVEVLAA